MDLYKEILVWKRLDEYLAVRYCCFHDMQSGKYAVQSADFFRIPFVETQFREFEKQFVELFIDVSPKERCDWYDSIEEAIKTHDECFSPV